MIIPNGSVGVLDVLAVFNFTVAHGLVVSLKDGVAGCLSSFQCKETSQGNTTLATSLVVLCGY